jgi:hypothetical protein
MIYYDMIKSGNSHNSILTHIIINNSMDIIKHLRISEECVWFIIGDNVEMSYIVTASKETKNRTRDNIQ